MVTFRNVNFLKQTLLEYYSHEPGIAKISGAFFNQPIQSRFITESPNQR